MGLQLALGTFIALRILPSPPAIVHAPDYEAWEVMHPRETFLYDADGNYDGTASVPPWAMSWLWHRIMDCIQQATWLTTRLAQIRLNHRRSTFAGMYKVTAYLKLASLSLCHVTTVAVRYFGRSKSMQAFRLWDFVTLMVEAILVVQARALPSISQSESVNKASESSPFGENA